MSGFDLLIERDPEDPDAAEVLVEGAVGATPRRFLLDTGCARTTLRHDALTAGFEPLGSDESAGVFESARYDSIAVDEVSLGPIVGRSLVLSRAREGALRRDLIGMDLLRHHALHFRFSERRVDLLTTDGGTRSLVELRAVVPSSGPIPHVEVVCGESVSTAVWDTGAGVTLVDAGFVERTPTSFERVGSSVGTDSSGASRETPVFLMKGPVVAGHALPSHRVVGFDLSFLTGRAGQKVTFILGYSTLALADWVFDFPGRRWGISRVIAR